MPRSRSRRKVTKPTASRSIKRPQKTPYSAVEVIEYPDGSRSIVSYQAGTGRIDPKARYFAKTLDTDWFRAHPRRSHRIRQAIAGETPNVSSSTYIIVRQVKPGYHERVNFEALVPIPEGDAPEHLAHAFFDLLREAPVRVIHLGELQARMHAYQKGGGTEGPSAGNLLTVH